jgi:hypothetical protein
MKSFKTSIPSIFAVILSFVFVALFPGVGDAEMKPLSPIQRKDVPTVGSAFKTIPNLNVNLSITKGPTGLLTLSGTISNIGTGDFAVPSEAQIVMNLCYPPKTYAQSGISDILYSKDFASLKKGASIPFSINYQIPDFGGWNSAAVPLNAKRLFTLRVVKKDMSVFQATEENNPNNNAKAVEINYLEKK